MSDMVTVQAMDGPEFTVPRAVAAVSVTLKNMMEDCDTATAMPLPSVRGSVLTTVLAFCAHYVAAAADDATVAVDSDWGRKLAGLERAELFDVILAANYLDVAPLLNLACHIVANMIKGKTVEEIRAIFGIDNDFTPEEEEEVRRENEWCEER